MKLFAMICPLGGRRHSWAASLVALRRHGAACPFCGQRCEVRT